MLLNQPDLSLADYLTIGEAAEVLGVSPWTLRNWDRAGKLKTLRHPKNGYRIYRREDLEQVLRPEGLPHNLQGRLTPNFEWGEVGDSGHFVQFYERDAYLVGSVTGFIGAALEAGDGAVIVVTPAHRNAIQRKLRSRGLDLTAARASGQYVALDAAETLARFMIDGSPDPRRFAEVIGEVFTGVSRGRARVRAFGEMVALLWADGNRKAAIQLEELWNDLARVHTFTLLCGYPIGGFSGEAQEAPFGDVCKCHTRVVPAESYAGLPTEDERLRAVSRLQQRAQALEAEIAHREEVERALARRERELADFLDNAVEGLHRVGPDGRIIWANRAELEMLGYRAEEYIGRHITEFHADRDVIEGVLAKLLRGESLYNQPARLRHKDGSIRHVLIHSNGCFEGEEFVYTRCFTRDVTELHRAEEAVREAGRRKDEFLATLAHELRNPLAPIRNALQIMQMAAGNLQAVELARAMMERQVQQVVRLVDDLLDISRITRGKVELKKERVALSSVAAFAVETSRPMIEAARHELIVGLPTETLELDADPARLAQVISNLLNNAAKYSEPGSRIWLTAQREGNRVAVRVRDAGIGIPAEMLPRIFDMFVQADRSLDRSQGGLGIGLTLVRTLVEMHGGTVEAHSDGPGHGSEFVMRLPLAAPRRPLPVGRGGHQPGSPALPPRRVLIVDDNEDAAQSLAVLLGIMGQDVRTASDGPTALETARDFRPHLAFLDIGLPGMSGHELALELRRIPGGADILLAALTGWGQDEDRQRSREAGFDIHLTKPADPAVLGDLIKRAGQSA